MSSYTIPTDWTTADLIEALLPPESLTVYVKVFGTKREWLEWLERVEAIRHSQQAKPAQPELLHVAERKAY